MLCKVTLKLKIKMIIIYKEERKAVIIYSSVSNRKLIFIVNMKHYFSEKQSQCITKLIQFPKLFIFV